MHMKRRQGIAYMSQGKMLITIKGVMHENGREKVRV
jgi:hypothetical protein